MYCPQCGVESAEGLQYCRSCGANLKVIGKALTLSEAIARSDRGPLPKIKEMVKNLKVDHMTEEVSKALDHMNKEIVKHTRPNPHVEPWWRKRKKTARERREEKITKGTIQFFSGIGVTIFLYFLSAALVLKIPPHILAQIPFEIDPVVHMIWLVGLISVLSGVGHIIAGLLIRPRPEEDRILQESNVREFVPAVSGFEEERDRTLETSGIASVTERTTNLLEMRNRGNTARTERREEEV